MGKDRSFSGRITEIDSEILFWEFSLCYTSVPHVFSWREYVYGGILLTTVGIIISFYTEYGQGITPCFSCYLLRYSYIALLVLFATSLKLRNLLPLNMLISALIIAISLWGFIGYLGYVGNPCIEACPLGESLEVGFRLFTLSLIGGVIVLLLSIGAFIRSKSG